MSSKELTMKVTEFKIQGPKLLQLKAFADQRGFFVERYKKQAFVDAGIPYDFVQDNFSTSRSAAHRGIHYQYDRPQGKLVTATRGQVLDVIVDLRKSSPTCGEHIAVEIDGAEPKWLWVPAGFAHGFFVLGNDSADVFYKVDNYYNAQGEGGILWSDTALKIPWPSRDPIVSEKDGALPKLAEYLKDSKF